MKRASDSNYQSSVKRKRRWLRRIVKGFFVLIVVLSLGVPLLFSFLITKAKTRSDERARIDTPATKGVSYEDVSFGSSDGISLSGWYLPADKQPITIVMTHGMFRSRYEVLERGIELWKRGYSVLLYDVRRHGKSSGECFTLGCNERKDVLAAMDYVRKRSPHNRIALFGISMGAAASLFAAAENKDLLGVVAESSYLSFKDVIYHHVGMLHVPTFPFAWIIVKNSSWQMDINPVDCDVERAVKSASCPILFIGGTKDKRMPNEKVLEPLYQASGNSKSKKFIVDDASHGRAYEANKEEYIKTICEFLDSCMI
jgi:pimeloyl-ACP methyl ester carboxylesterase